MLRSLDPERDYSAPKSKEFHPTKGEERKFSPGELEYLSEATTQDEELRVRRFVAQKKHEAAYKAATGS